MLNDDKYDDGSEDNGGDDEGDDGAPCACLACMAARGERTPLHVRVFCDDNSDIDPDHALAAALECVSVIPHEGVCEGFVNGTTGPKCAGEIEAACAVVIVADRRDSKLLLAVHPVFMCSVCTPRFLDAVRRGNDAAGTNFSECKHIVMSPDGINSVQ